MIVVDASAAVLGLLNDGDVRRSLASESIAVPHLVDSELANGLRSGVSRGAIDEQHASGARSLGEAWGPALSRRWTPPPRLGAPRQPDGIRRQLRSVRRSGRERPRHCRRASRRRRRPDLPDTGGENMSDVHTAMTNTVNEGHRKPSCRPGQSGIHTVMPNTSQPHRIALPASTGEWRRRLLARRRRDRARPAHARRRDRLANHRAACIAAGGLAGGEPGALGENWLLPGGDESRAERLLDKCTIRLRAGDVLRMLTPGGGGWGSSP